MIRAVVLLAAIAAVSAHVSMFPTTAVIGQKTYVYAQVAHSCDSGNAANTIGISVRIPTNLTAQPVTVPGYTLTRSFRTLPNQHQQLDWVTWTTSTGGFPTWQLSLFPISITFPASYFTAGRKVYFQIVQYCDGVDAQAQSNWTYVATPTASDDLDLYYAAMGEPAPTITPTAAASAITYVNTTTYQVIGSMDDDSWSQDSTIAVIALILAALSWVAWFYTWCHASEEKKRLSASAHAQSAPPAGSSTTPSAAAAGSFVAV